MSSKRKSCCKQGSKGKLLKRIHKTEHSALAATDDTYQKAYPVKSNSSGSDTASPSKTSCPQTDTSSLGNVKANKWVDEAKKSILPSQRENELHLSGGKRMLKSFFDIPCIDLAKALLGKYLVRQIGSERVSGIIVETEAYLGLEDKAAHSYQGKRTRRNEAMFMEPGTAYVYNIYGMYACLNISSQGDGCAVLLRALQPIENIEVMRSTREIKSSKRLKDKEMTNGPSKLCQALQISKVELNKTDLTCSSQLWLEDADSVPSHQVVCCPRINIGYAEDWKVKPLRFYILKNSCVSVRDKNAEALLLQSLQAT